MHYLVPETFKAKGYEGYVTETMIGGPASPLLHIVCESRLALGKEKRIDLPEGFDEERLDEVVDMARTPNKETEVSRELGRDLELIGGQLLSLNYQTEIRLAEAASTAIQRLVDVVQTVEELDPQ